MPLLGASGATAENGEGAAALLTQRADFCPDHDHASVDCLTPETTTHEVTTWRAAGPTGHRLYINAETVELDVPALDDLLAHLTAERSHM